MTRLLAIFFAVALGVGATLAQAQLRSIPADAKRGEMVHVEDTAVEIGGKRMRLAAGAQIRGANNLIVLPSALPPRSLVKYTVDPQGDVFRVWILSAQEAAQPDRKE